MYGDPIVLTSYSHIRKEISILLEKNTYPSHSKNQLQYKLSSYKSEATIFLPFSWLKNHRYGTGISEKNVVSLNMYIQHHFEISFFVFIMERINNDKRFNGMTNIIEEFANHYNIMIDEDITMDAIVKIAFRLRNKFCNPSPAPTAPKKKIRYQQCYQQNLFAPND